ncbi:hypothetical protein HGRIS_000170 [Hohenbuehelia grisea]|uniref:Pectate lyase domain-containing protein n=1 Tax=Hohenbuehelia grisea TaxID=104357 RepID=A0ABR3JQ95_9AGAR
MNYAMCYAFLGVLAVIQGVNGLRTYNGPVPNLQHSPFGWGGQSTGGSLNKSATYIVSNSTELREALALPFTKTIYVDGVIHGNQLDNGSFATCETFIATSGSPGSAVRQFDFNLYIFSLNSTYLSLVTAAAAANETFEGRNATEYRALLGHQNGWRPVVAATMKAQVGFKLTNNTSLIGLNEGAALNGINLYLSSVNNVWIRNLKLVSPKDCFPAPETFPSSWNALYDAVGIVTASNVWVDNCELQDQLSGEWVEPDVIPPGWQVDRFDGLFDCEDGTDNVTFSHNIVRNHHKSLLLGGGTKEADRDLGRMHFTIFGNHFDNSASRNPLMRFGTFEVFANLYKSRNDKAPLFTSSSSLRRQADEPGADVPLDALFQYHLGIYNQSTVHVQDNVFIQGGAVANDTSRIFTLSEDTLPQRPARLCLTQGGETAAFPSTMNGEPINLADIAQGTIDYFVAKGSAAEGAVLLTCDGFEVASGLPRQFSSAEEVAQYVRAEAGQTH